MGTPLFAGKNPAAQNRCFCILYASGAYTCFGADKNGISFSSSAKPVFGTPTFPAVKRRGIYGVQAFVRHGKKVLVYSARGRLYIARERATGDFEEYPVPVVRKFLLKSFKAAFSDKKYMLFGFHKGAMIVYESQDLRNWSGKTVSAEGFKHSDAGAVSVFGAGGKHYAVYSRGGDSLLGEGVYDGEKLAIGGETRIGAAGMLTAAVDTGRYLIYGSDGDEVKVLSASIIRVGESGFGLKLTEVK